MMINGFLKITLYLTIPLGIFLWLGIFLNTVRYFPKLGRKDKIRAGILNATLITLSIAALIAVALVLVLRNLNL